MSQHHGCSIRVLRSVSTVSVTRPCTGILFGMRSLEKTLKLAFVYLPLVLIHAEYKIHHALHMRCKAVWTLIYPTKDCISTILGNHALHSSEGQRCKLLYDSSVLPHYFYIIQHTSLAKGVAACFEEPRQQREKSLISFSCTLHGAEL